MTRNFKNFLGKVFISTSIMVVGFYVWQNVGNANITQETTPELNVAKENSAVYQNTSITSLGKTGVAITTNIGIKYKQRTEIPATIYSDVFSVNKLLNNSFDGSSEIIASNMLITQEYQNVLKTDIKGILANAKNKGEILDAIIEQLEFRYEKAAKQINNLNEQKNIFENEMTAAETKVESLKVKINTDFKNKDANASKENIDEYLKQKNAYYYARTYIIYINKFLLDYTYLNEYNKKLLDTLINNKEALIKDAYVVIPDTGTSLLKDFDLLYDEATYKATK
ncbi:MAG: hypothetical protein PHH98_02375 [Candidatus Gracilibacteria bacterium]|nr:hypothetical protein [Candidatus Gracilibacteria bacterium]